MVARLPRSSFDSSGKHFLSKCLALSHVARLHSLREPLHSLLSRSVCKGLGYNVALCAFLDLVVTNGGRSTDRFFGVTCFDEAFGLRAIGPYTCIAVGL